MMYRFARRQLATSAALLLAIAQRCTGQPQRFLLVLSHMRSGSTLLHHLLQTNPEIIGGGESLRALHAPMDLSRLALRVRLTAGGLFARRIVVADQINHTHISPGRDLLARAQVSTVFLVRDPRGSIGSMAAHLGRTYDWSLQRSIDYYIERTSALCTLAAELGQLQPRQAFALNYEALTFNATDTLDALRRHLGLEQAFATQYGLHSYSGRRGDPSPRILTGRILPADLHDELALNPSLEQMLHQHYQQVLDILGRNCSAVLADGRRNNHG